MLRSRGGVILKEVPLAVAEALIKPFPETELGHGIRHFDFNSLSSTSSETHLVEQALVSIRTTQINVTKLFFRQTVISTCFFGQYVNLKLLSQKTFCTLTGCSSHKWVQ